MNTIICSIDRQAVPKKRVEQKKSEPGCNRIYHVYAMCTYCSIFLYDTDSGGDLYKTIRTRYSVEEGPRAEEVKDRRRWWCGGWQGVVRGGEVSERASERFVKTMQNWRAFRVINPNDGSTRTRQDIIIWFRSKPVKVEPSRRRWSGVTRHACSAEIEEAQQIHIYSELFSGECNATVHAGSTGNVEKTIEMQP